MTGGAAADLPALRVHGPAELLDAVPYLLGFRPHRSLVLVGLHGTRLVVTARIDLAELGHDGGAQLLTHTVAALADGGSTSLVALVFDASASVGLDAARGVRLPHTSLAAGVADVCDRLEVDLIEAVLCGERAWWSYQCADPSCCPPAGHPLPAGDSRVAAEATFAGLVALPDRGNLERLLSPREPGPDEALELESALAAAEREVAQAVARGESQRLRRSQTRAVFAASRRAGTADSPLPITPAERARLAVALRSIEVRDAVWMAVDDGRLDGRPLWRELACALPAPYASGPLFLFGWRSWRAGNGALAAIAAQRAVEADPLYSAADLLLAALDRGVDPRRLPRLRLPRPA